MNEDHVGEWVQRTYNDRRYNDTKLHLIESKINDAYITKCGRRMVPQTEAQVPNRLVFSAPQPAHHRNCSRCE
jgi:hypothetical protein